MTSVMLDHLAAERGIPLTVASAGTHAVDGVPVGARTLAALRTIPALEPSLVKTSAHRSSQLGAGHFETADLVVAMETAHVRFVRSQHPDAAHRTGMLRALVRDLPPGTAPLCERVAAMRLEHTYLDPADDVADPAGHDDDAYLSCAAELWELCAALVNGL